jgi:hypothetical protein
LTSEYIISENIRKMATKLDTIAAIKFYVDKIVSDQAIGGAWKMLCLQGYL